MYDVAHVDTSRLWLYAQAEDTSALPSVPALEALSEDAFLQGATKVSGTAEAAHALNSSSSNNSNRAGVAQKMLLSRTASGAFMWHATVSAWGTCPLLPAISVSVARCMFELQRGVEGACEPALDGIATCLGWLAACRLRLGDEPQADAHSTLVAAPGGSGRASLESACMQLILQRVLCSDRAQSPSVATQHAWTSLLQYVSACHEVVTVHSARTTPVDGSLPSLPGSTHSSSRSLRSALVSAMLRLLPTLKAHSSTALAGGSQDSNRDGLLSLCAQRVPMDQSTDALHARAVDNWHEEALFLNDCVESTLEVDTPDWLHVPGLMFDEEPVTLYTVLPCPPATPAAECVRQLLAFVFSATLMRIQDVGVCRHAYQALVTAAAPQPVRTARLP
ncbi:MAG: hypothetical protein EOO41_04575 [Methanobacteriota archaeon]|nr:MAG: hypothetical protein EOO41_04575 [Euryarchaeota archaeon]